MTSRMATPTAAPIEMPAMAPLDMLLPDPSWSPESLGSGSGSVVGDGIAEDAGADDSASRGRNVSRLSSSLLSTDGSR